MKKIYTIIVLFVSIGFSAYSQSENVDSIFTTANLNYSQQEFAASVDLYQTIVDSSYKSAELYFNLGNSYFKLGQHARAILYYEKALILNSKDVDIQFNLAKANAYTIDKIEVIPEFFLLTWLRGVISIFSSNIWAFIALFVFVVSLVFFLVYFINASRNKKVVAFSIGAITLLLSITFLLFAFKTKDFVEESDRAIVIESTVTVKSSPDIDGVNVFIVHEGTKVILVRSIGNWYEIKLADGKQGWLEKLDIEKI